MAFRKKKLKQKPNGHLRYLRNGKPNDKRKKVAKEELKRWKCDETHQWKMNL